MSDLAAAQARARTLIPPTQSGRRENVLAAAIAAWPLDVEAIEREDDADTCSPEQLPFLFFDAGGRFWSDAWSEARKRWVVRNRFTLARLQGTPLGVEINLNLADCFVVAEHLPPGRVAAIPNRRIDKAAIDALMPQLRLYHSWRTKGSRQRAMAGVGLAGRALACPGRGHTLGRKPVLWDRGAETELGVADLALDGQTARLRQRTFPGRAAIIGRAVAGRSILAPAMRPAPIVFRADDPSSVFVPDLPAPNPWTAIARRAVTGRAIAVSQFGKGRGYDRIVLFDPSRLHPNGNARLGAVAGVSQLGVPRHTVQLKVALPASRRWRFNRRPVAGRDLAVRRDPRPLALAIEGIRTAKRGGDRVLLEFADTAAGARFATLPDLDKELSA